MEQEQTPLPCTPHEAWGHMRELLDQAMPVEKKRRRFAVWWLLPVALAAVGWWLLAGRGHSPAVAANDKTASNMQPPANQQTGKQPVLNPAPAAPENPVVMASPQSANKHTVKPVGPVTTHSGTTPSFNRPFNHHNNTTALRRSKKRRPGYRDFNASWPGITTAPQTVLQIMDVETADNTESFYTLHVPIPVWQQAQQALQAVTQPLHTQSSPVTAAQPAGAKTKQLSLRLGIRSGVIVNNLGWAATKKALFPQRLAPLELFIEKPLTKTLSVELGLNLFSTRNIRYRLAGADSGTDAAGVYRLHKHDYTAQGLHFADVQLLLHRNLRGGWRLHSGVYASALKNIAVEVNTYDSSSAPAGNGRHFSATTVNGYTYARKLNGIDLVSPFRKSDFGLLAGIGYGRGKLQTGLSVQWGLMPLYKPAADANTGGPRHTLQLKYWLGWRIGR